MLILNFGINKLLRTFFSLLVFYIYHSNLIIMLKFFKIVALMEGVSYLVLFSNMLIVKPANLELYKSLLYPIGMAHGLLFITYIILATILKFQDNWSFKKFGIIGIASLIPFGTFYIDKKYLRNV
jgi:integral membrane protein